MSLLASCDAKKVVVKLHMKKKIYFQISCGALRCVMAVCYWFTRWRCMLFLSKFLRAVPSVLVRKLNSEEVAELSC